MIPFDGDWVAAIDAHARARGTGDRRVPASLLLQGYARRLAEPVVAALVRGDAMPDPRGERVGVHLVDGWIDRVVMPPATDTIQPFPGEDRLAWAHDRLIAGNLAPTAATVRRSVRIGPRTLWGNVASALASAFRAAAGEGRSDPAPVLPLAQAFLDRDRRTRGLVRLFLIHDGGRTRLVHERATCCLAYQVPATRHCVSCPLLPPHERRLRLLEVVDLQVRGEVRTPATLAPDAGSLDAARASSGERREAGSLHRAGARRAAT